MGQSLFFCDLCELTFYTLLFILLNCFASQIEISQRAFNNTSLPPGLSVEPLIILFPQFKGLQASTLLETHYAVAI